jgi:hypothetical protein
MHASFSAALLKNDVSQYIGFVCEMVRASPSFHSWHESFLHGFSA